jgi:hypothetical protein
MKEDTNNSQPAGQKPLALPSKKDAAIVILAVKKKAAAALGSLHKMTSHPQSGGHLDARTVLTTMREELRVQDGHELLQVLQAYIEAFDEAQVVTFDRWSSENQYESFPSF